MWFRGPALAWHSWDPEFHLLCHMLKHKLLYKQYMGAHTLLWKPRMCAHALLWKPLVFLLSKSLPLVLNYFFLATSAPNSHFSLQTN